MNREQKNNNNKPLCKNVPVGEIKMELRNKTTNRCRCANESHRNEPLIEIIGIASKLNKHLRSFFVKTIDICTNYCELMTFNSSDVHLMQTYCQQSEKCTKLTVHEYAIHDKMVTNRDENNDENSYVYFVNNNNNSDEKIKTNCGRGAINRTNGITSSKSKIKQFFRGHSINVLLILIVFSLGFIDMVNGKFY